MPQDADVIDERSRLQIHRAVMAAQSDLVKLSTLCAKSFA